MIDETQPTGTSALEIVTPPETVSKVHPEILALYPEIETSTFDFYRRVVSNEIKNSELAQLVKHLRSKEGPKNTRELEVAEKLLELRTNGKVLPSPLETQAVSGPTIAL